GYRTGLALAPATALAVAVRKPPRLSRLHDRQPVARGLVTQVVSLVHCDEQLARAGEVGETDGCPDAGRLGAQVRAVGQERHHRAREVRGGRAVIARGGDAEPDAAVRTEGESV